MPAVCRQASCESFRFREILSRFREAGYERPSLGRVCSARVLGLTRRL